MFQFIRKVLENRRTALAIAAVYFLACFVHFPSRSSEFRGVAHWGEGPLVLALPRVLSGDSPHYLVSVHSLVEDGDFDLRNNYDAARAGAFEAGVRFRGVELDRHVDTDSRGRQLGTHSPFFALLLSFFAWPFAGTAWVEPVCVVLTCLCGVATVLLLTRRVAAVAENAVV